MIKKNKKLTQLFSQWLSFQSRSNKKDELKLHKPKKLQYCTILFSKRMLQVVSFHCLNNKISEEDLP